MKIHILWVGQPLENISDYSFLIQDPWELFNTSNSKIEIFKEIKNYFQNIQGRDIAGFLTFLEEIIRTKIANIQLYFHCFEHAQSIYQNIFEEFELKFAKKHGIINFKFKSIVQVVSFEETLKLYSEIDAKTGKKIENYLNFIKDERTKNLRHFNFCKEIFAFCILYIYGGYTFDGNVFVLPPKFQALLQNNKSNFDSFLNVSLFNTLEQNCIFDARSLNLQYSRRILKFDNQSYSTTKKLPEGSYFPRNTTNLFWTNNICTDFAQRASAKSEELRIIIDFMITEIQSLILKCYNKQFAQTEEHLPKILNQYLMMAGGLSPAAPIFPKLKDFNDPKYPAPPNELNDLKEYLHKKTIFLEGQKTFVPLIPLNREKSDIFSCIKYIECDTYLFSSFPLIKFSYKSYGVKPEYSKKDIYIAECAAASEWLKSNA